MSGSGRPDEKGLRFEESRATRDNRGVTDTADRVPSALLFTQGESSVHMEVTERRDGGLHLAVRGPGLAVAEYEFPDLDALLAFTRQEEMRLTAEGFQLQAVAERRSGAKPPPGTARDADRRRVP